MDGVPVSDLTVSELTARLKYQKALKLIEQAQNTLSDACQELCPLIGAVDQWEDCGRAYDHVHDLWRRIAYSVARDNVRMDGL
jgi:hypothetical protein